MRGARGAGVLVVALTGAVVLVACGGGGGSDAAATTTAVPSKCAAPPVTVDIEAGGSAPAGGKDFEVTDAVARRVAILPGEMAFDSTELSGLDSKAGITPLALYTLYLSDFSVDSDDLSGVSKHEVRPPKNKTVAALRLVPTAETGFGVGDVVRDGKLDYDTNTELTPLSLTVLTNTDTKVQAHTKVSGEATIVELTDDSICVDFDVTVSGDDGMVYAAKGVVEAPVVRSADAFFVT